MKTRGCVLFYKVVSKKIFHREVVFKSERYEKRCKEFDVAEEFRMECQNQQIVGFMVISRDFLILFKN